MSNAPVGIVANPASGRDVRGLVARASVFPLAEKCSMISRLLTALASTGIRQVLLMPDRSGLAERVRRALTSPEATGQWPGVKFLEMPIQDGPADTVRAVKLMVEYGVAAIVVLGGDGTHRLVASVCGEVPLMGLSTGTNNVFPQIREATIAGIATGLVATGRVSKSEATQRNKVLEVSVDGCPRTSALVDVSISTQAWVGSKAIWRPDTLNQIFVTFAEPDALGLSSVAGLLQPVPRHAPYGLQVDLVPPEKAPTILKAPIAPGLVVPLGVACVREIPPNSPQRIKHTHGVIGLDGEREVEFQPNQSVTIELDLQGPFTIDTERVMAKAAEQGLMLSSALDHRDKENSIYATQPE